MIPLIFLIAMIVIGYKMYKEYKERKRINSLIKYFETDSTNLSEEDLFIIEQKAQIAKLDYAPHWKMQFRGQFNILNYVEYLEHKYGNAK